MVSRVTPSLAVIVLVDKHIAQMLQPIVIVLLNILQAQVHPHIHPQVPQHIVQVQAPHLILQAQAHHIPRVLNQALALHIVPANLLFLLLQYLAQVHHPLTQ